MVSCESERKSRKLYEVFYKQSPLVITVHFLMLPEFSTLAFGILVENSDRQ